MSEAQTPMRFRVVPILGTLALAIALPYLGAYTAVFANRYVHLYSVEGANLPWLYAQHGFQLLYGLIAIGLLKIFVPADYGLHLPRGRTYYLPAILWGLFFGALMTVVDYAPQLMAHTKPDLGFPLTQSNVTGWLFFEGVYVGPTEEIPFRAVLVTFLAATMPGKLRVGRFEMNWAGVIVAVLFALLHATDFEIRQWPQALGQQFYAFALGVLYAYWLEKSKSIVAPIIGHNVSDFSEYLIGFAWVGAF
jgi:uncharacterized protein